MNPRHPRRLRRTLLWLSIVLVGFGGVGGLFDRNWPLVGLAAVAVFLAAFLLRSEANRPADDPRGDGD